MPPRCCAGPYWEEVAAPLQELLQRNNITTAANITLQMIGGGSRIPRVQADLAKVLEDLSLERQLDADEAPAMGAGLMAANLSTTFRLRQFGMQDGIIHPISISLEPGEGIPDTHSVRHCPALHRRLRALVVPSQLLFPDVSVAASHRVKWHGIGNRWGHEGLPS